MLSFDPLKLSDQFKYYHLPFQRNFLKKGSVTNEDTDWSINAGI